MRKTTVAAIQMGCGSDVKENIEKASELIREAAAQGAQVILPPELFERPYFCQERRYEYYGYARTLEENDAVIHMKKLAKELETVIPVSFYEAGDHRQMFNSVAVIDADGSVCGIYRKTHLRNDQFFSVMVCDKGHHEWRVTEGGEPSKKFQQHSKGKNIIADKTDVRRNRVRNKAKENFDIHDRVNYAVTDAALKINMDKKVIALNLQIDTKICSMYEYFEIFLGRMMMCRGAAEVLGATFKLTANGSKVL